MGWSSDFYSLTLGIDFMARMAPVPLSNRCGAIHMLDNFSPTTAIVSTKTNFSLLSCYGDTGISDGGKNRN
jgi:hypothetical protein